MEDSWKQGGTVKRQDKGRKEEAMTPCKRRGAENRKD